MKKILTLLFAATLSATALADSEVSDGKLFTSNTQAVSLSNPTHRIPAIATFGDNIIAFCDERSSSNGGDTGSGRIDIVCRISNDNGKTWSDKQTVAPGGKDFNGNISSNFAYGDPAVVIDRETGKILVLAAAGTVSYSSSQASYSRQSLNVSGALRIAKITGTPTIDANGKIISITWDSPTDLSSKIYGLYTYSSGIYVTKAFFGSGRICQSTLVKNLSASASNSYRLYAALTTNRGSVVVYSDDFGSTWACLGAASAQPASGGDEAKVEELPNGDVLLVAKNNNGQGRIFNVYHWTNLYGGSGAAGSWGTATTQTSLTAARCNGENYDPYYYLSSYKGDGYIGKVDAKNYSTGATQRSGVGCTTNYAWEFKFRDFVKQSVLANGNGSKVVEMTGVALNYIDTNDKSKNKYVSLNQNGELNWHDHTIKGEATNNDSKIWSTDFTMTEVTRINPNTDGVTPSCGTKASPTEYGFPITFTRHDNDHQLLSFEDYHYYATLKLPFAVSLPKNVKAYKVNTKQPTSTSGNYYEVGLTEIDLETSANIPDGETTGARILPRETPVVLMMTNDQAGDDGRTAAGDVQKTVYLTPEQAQLMQTTGFLGTLGKRIFTTDEYNPSSNANWYILSKVKGRVAFRYLAGQTINANKAYYVYDGNANGIQSLAFVFNDGETTAIDRVIAIDDIDDNAPAYNLAGQRVGADYKGIVIQNGRKVIRK